MAPAAAAQPGPYFAASGVSALACFPLWKAAAIGQSGYQLQAKSPFQRYLEAMKPPWRGALNVVFGMTWARAAIFFGSERGRQAMQTQGMDPVLSTAMPPILISTIVQLINQPFTRASIMLQDPQSVVRRRAILPTCFVLKHLLSTKGVGAWWVGTSAAVLKTVPKYVTAIAVKDVVGTWLAPVQKRRTDSTTQVLCSATKAVTAGVAGALLTNPLDVLRNEMFKTEEGLVQTFRQLSQNEGRMWPLRGCGKNLVAVAVPIASTIFFTDIFAAW
mmetsp:Transcript_89944/g.262881  ORF Transcript_89944/g.262881 Transcript_89944/m.262881 type:complete len:274 (+) Transcript_89944:66-887(+)